VDTGTNTSGCEAEDFAGFTAGRIALMKRGVCSFSVKINNASDAGAIGALIVDHSEPIATGALIDPTSIPAVMISLPVGTDLLNLLSGGDVSMRLALSSIPEPSVTSLSVTPVDSTISVGRTRQFTATGFFSDGSRQAMDWLSHVTAVAAGGRHTCAALGDGTVQCWGRNFNGQLGDGTTDNASTPRAVTGITTATAIAAGGAHTCALLADGTAQCWGNNGNGQLGSDTFSPFFNPIPDAVDGISAVMAVTAGSSHTCALLADGTVRCWGFNGFGQLGNGSLADSSDPVTVSGLSTATAVSAGSSHTCALLADRTVQCWGAAFSRTPVEVAGITTATAIAAGGSHTCARLADGTVACWGSNSDGQLGNDSTMDSTTPVAVHDITAATAIAAGFRHTCARLTGGTVQCWGDNQNGQLGDGTTTAATTPVAVSRIERAWAIAAGGSHSCAPLGYGGRVQCWGDNEYGQLGDGTNTDSATQRTVVAVTWSSSTSVASIDPIGLAAGLSPGTTTITATLGPLRGHTTLTVVLNQPPVVTAGEDQMIFLGQITLLTATAVDPDGEPIAAWTWTIDSAPAGSSPSLSDPTRPDPIFDTDRAGDYLLSVAAWDPMALPSAPDSVVIHVVPILPPVAVATADVTTGPVTAGPVPLTVHFDASQSYDPQGAPLTYLWDFGDASLSSSEIAPVHTYSHSAVYIVQLRVFSSTGLIGADTLEIAVTDPSTPPAGIPITEIRVTSTSAIKATPTLGADATSRLVVYTILNRSVGLPFYGFGQIFYQRLSTSGLLGFPVLVSEGGTNDQFNDVSGDYIVYTSYLDATSGIGEVKLYEISSGMTTVISQLSEIHEARVHGRMVTWVEDITGTGSTRVMLLNLDLLGRGDRPIQIGGWTPPASNVEIGSNLVVWTEVVGPEGHGQLDVAAYDMRSGTRLTIASDPGLNEVSPSTSGSWVTWQAGVGPTTIEAYNVDTGERRTLGHAGAVNLSPTIDGDVIAFESNATGNFDIYIYRISTEETFPVTSQGADQHSNNVFGNQVAYIDLRDGGTNLFVSSFELPTIHQGDFDGDADVDQHDLTILLSDRNKTVTASACGAACDLDGDGMITALDSRILVTLCTRPRCATS
jgi:alpha-tubulin suppressor-like RCC1 family protein/PKD repeat protein